jgi:hypothetical protein
METEIRDLGEIAYDKKQIVVIDYKDSIISCRPSCACMTFTVRPKENKLIGVLHNDMEPGNSKSVFITISTVSRKNEMSKNIIELKYKSV